MKVAGKVIQDRNIFENTEDKFDAIYKNQRIIVEMIQLPKRGNPTFEFYIFGNKNGENKTNGSVQRCNIKDALIYALKQAGLC